MHASLHPSSRLEKSLNIYDKQLKDDKVLSCIFLHLYKSANETEEIEPNGNRLRSKSFTELNGFNFEFRYTCPQFTVYQSGRCRTELKSMYRMIRLLQLSLLKITKLLRKRCVTFDFFLNCGNPSQLNPEARPNL
jgi:hypothetical protein